MDVQSNDFIWWSIYQMVNLSALRMSYATTSSSSCNFFASLSQFNKITHVLCSSNNAALPVIIPSHSPHNPNSILKHNHQALHNPNP